jgi:hypothetical protein
VGRSFGFPQGGFADDAVSLRVNKALFLRRDELQGSNFIFFPTGGSGIIPALLDNGSQVAGALAAFDDRVFVVGYDGTNAGALYGMNIPYSYSLSASNTPILSYGDAPVDLLAVRGMSVSGSTDNQADYLFGAFPNSLFVELGTISSSNIYSQKYHHTTAAAPVRACYVSQGGSPDGATAYPVFAFSAGHGVYLVDTAGTIHTGITVGSDTPGPLFFDDNGFLWFATTTSNILFKCSVNFSTYSLTPVAIVSMGVTPLDMISDGRFARVLAYISGPTPTYIYSWDLQTALPGPVLNLSSITWGVTPAGRIGWDGVSFWVLTNAVGGGGGG